MFKFVANLSLLFNEVPFMERFSAARKAGFSYVEFMFPYDYKTEEIKEELKKNDLKLILFNLPAGDWDKGDRGIAVDPSRKKEFIDGVKKAVDTASELGVSKINCLMGNKCTAFPEKEVRKNLVENLRYAADELGKNNIKLLIEAVNHVNMPNFNIHKVKDAMKLISEVDNPNIFLQYDVYHAAKEKEDQRFILENYLDKIDHIQVADNPDRHQPGTGDIDYKYIFDFIKNSNYKGYISMEYVPEPDTLTSLKWLDKFGFKL